MNARQRRRHQRYQNRTKKSANSAGQKAALSSSINSEVYQYHLKYLIEKRVPRSHLAELANSLNYQEEGWRQVGFEPKTSFFKT